MAPSNPGKDGTYDMVPKNLYQLEYTKFPDNAYIDTGIKASQDLEIICKFSTTTPNRLLFGSRIDTSTSGLTFGYFDSSSFFVGFGGVTTKVNIQGGINLIDGAAHTVVLSNTKFTIDGISQSITRGTFSTTYSMLLGTWTNSSSPDNRYFIGNVYSFFVKQNGQYILKLYPAKYEYNTSTNAYYYGFVPEDYLKKKETFSGKVYESKTSTKLQGGPVMADTKSGIVTYKTIINKAIAGFNDIQTKLNSIGASYTSASGTTSAIAAPTEDNPLSVDNMLLSDAFRKASLTLTGSVSSTPTATLKSSTNTNIALASSSAYKIEIVKDGVTNGAVSHSGGVSKSGFITTSAALSQTSTAVGANVTAKVFYIQPGSKSAAVASTVPGSASASIGTESTGLASLNGATGSGVSTTAPTGTAGTDYFTLKPAISTSAGSATPKATITTEGYFGKDTTGVLGTAAAVSVNGNTGSTYYVSKLSSVTTSITSNASRTVTIGSLTDGYYLLTNPITGSANASSGGFLKKGSSVSLSATSVIVGRINALTTPTLNVSSSAVVSVGTASGGYYPLTTLLSGTISSTAGGYLPANGSVSASQNNASVGKIAAANYSASSTNSVSGFTASGSATSWYVDSVGTATISSAGYTPTGSKNGSTVRTYIPGATIKDGFTTSSGMVSSGTANYITQYNSADKCVDIIFNS